MTPAEQKQAEANGTGLKEIKSEVASNSSSEELPPFQKRSRRKECIYITIAVILGAGLIAVLVYFSVTNALKESEPEERKNTGAEYSTTESTTPLDYNFDYQSGGNDFMYDGQLSGNAMTRDASMPTRKAKNIESGSLARSVPGAEGGEQADTLNTEGADQGMTRMARVLPGPPNVEQADTQNTEGPPNVEQADTQNTEGDVQDLLKMARAGIPEKGTQTEGVDSEIPEQGTQTEGVDSENLDQNSQSADNGDGTDAGVFKMTKRLRNTEQGEQVEDTVKEQGTQTEGVDSGNTEQGEQVEDTVKESPEQNAQPEDNSQLPEPMTKVVRRPNRQPI